MKSHSYTTSGIILVIVIIICVSCSDKSINSNSGLKPVADFTVTETEISAGDTVTFQDASNNSPSLWAWDFEGGNPTYSNKQNPIVTYEGSGSYTVKMTSRNDYGADDITKVNYIIVTSPPVVDLDIDPQVRLDFEDNLNNTGLTGSSAITEGAEEYTVRPGGGKAFILNGSNQLTIPDYTGINGDGARSAALWINTTSDEKNAGLVNWGALGSFSRSSFKLQRAGFIRFEWQGGGMNASTNVIDGQWHHVAFTYDGNTVNLYVNGTLENSSSGITLRTGEAGETDVDIGSQLGAAATIFEGAIDDVRIFDVALTLEEVAILSNIK